MTEWSHVSVTVAAAGPVVGHYFLLSHCLSWWSVWVQLVMGYDDFAWHLIGSSVSAMSCKYLRQVGALEYAGACSDRCESPVGTGMSACFWGCGPLPVPLPRLSHQYCARALPPLPLRDPVIESTEHNVYFGHTSETSKWRQNDRDEGRKRQIKEYADNHSFLNSQVSLSSSVYLWSYVANPLSNSGQKAKSIIRHDMI